MLTPCWLQLRGRSLAVPLGAAAVLGALWRHQHSSPSPAAAVAGHHRLPAGVEPLQRPGSQPAQLRMAAGHVHQHAEVGSADFCVLSSAAVVSGLLPSPLGPTMFNNAARHPVNATWTLMGSATLSTLCCTVCLPGRHARECCSIAAPCNRHLYAAPRRWISPRGLLVSKLSPESALLQGLWACHAPQTGTGAAASVHGPATR